AGAPAPATRPRPRARRARGSGSPRRILDFSDRLGVFFRRLLEPEGPSLAAGRPTPGGRMDRRRFLKLAAVAGGTLALGGPGRLARGAASRTVPTVDRLVLTNVVDNVYDVFARGGRQGTLTVQRTPLGRRGEPALLAEHGLAFHAESLRGDERRQVLVDFSLTDRTLLNNYRVLGIEPTRADALVLSHGHGDHYGALP